MASTNQDIPALQLTIIEYGEGLRAEIDARPLLPSKDLLGDMPGIHEWAQRLLIDMSADLKHSQPWACAYCGQPARETCYQVVSRLNLSPPRLDLYVFHVCDSDNPPCQAELQAAQAQMALRSGQPPRGGATQIPRPPGVVYPLASSCAYCKEDNTADIRESTVLNRCSGCKLTRYCGVQCQKKDWPRHKKVCKTIKNVKWVW
ncbi:hypothetical protein GLOTRDRAFT_118283 [Gloeophyllum trabeum ATCC 11539]|uniref:MYND-type domain-containing protein n=1 Tax=Gloeophyllum trabeum (strain ATCC 11539 / FP-39264 / Madison 617) TaxID=670483 RepID=S7RDT6_GLOTA|nr:uncharacterized protein GLOTRDRAFT_118283 [Gloeophyllum trabeum ATCC 11539]EPQ50604.1 hypothetical protein GLOTRDRAFT_118283 [Gloeophyllum trabeum ATCC 11539]